MADIYSNDVRKAYTAHLIRAHRGGFVAMSLKKFSRLFLFEISGFAL